MQIIEIYPKQIPVPVVADLMGMSPENLRISIMQGNTTLFSLSWQKTGKDNKGFAIATAPFIRRWLNLNKM